MEFFSYVNRDENVQNRRKNFQLNGKAMKIFSTVFFLHRSERINVKTFSAEWTTCYVLSYYRTSSSEQDECKPFAITHLYVPHRAVFNAPIFQSLSSPSHSLEFFFLIAEVF